MQRAEEYKWSSARAHLNKETDNFLSDFCLLEEIKDWSRYLQIDEREEDLWLFRRHGATGKPLGSSEFIEELSRKLKIDLRPKKKGRKPK